MLKPLRHATSTRSNVRCGSNASVSRCLPYVRSTPNSGHFRARSALRSWAKCGYAARQSIKERGRRDPPNRMASQWASFPRQNCAPSVAARGGVILLRGGIDVPRERTSAVVPREKFQELPVLGIPGMSESAFDGWALEGAANGPTTAASVVASAVPGATTSGMPPSSTTYPRPTSYPGSPPPVIFPNTRPVIMPGFRLHRHRH